jgi:hypothetical protein
MNTKLLMSLSAAFMAILGVATTFLPQEILAQYGVRATAPLVLPIQILGALYLGFAALNWTARSNLIGGIYSRPVALANLLHFAVVAITLVKALLAGASRPPEISAAAAIYTAFAVWFALVIFTHPIEIKKDAA